MYITSILLINISVRHVAIGKGPFLRMEFNIQTSPKCFFNKERTYPKRDMMKEKNEKKN